MVGNAEHVLYAAVLFIGGHLLSSTPMRAILVRRFGEGAYRGLYSVLVGIAFVWMLWAYGEAAYVPLWTPPPWVAWIPILAVPLAMILVVAAVTTRNPSMAGMEDAVRAPQPAVGIMTVTRHPLFWGIAIWALAHIPPNGDLASLYLFGGLALLALAGMPLQDHRKAQALGADWGPFVMRSSALPFAAVLEGRTEIDWRGIGWWRPLAGLALYAIVLGGHRHIFGVSPWPG